MASGSPKASARPDRLASQEAKLARRRYENEACAVADDGVPRSFGPNPQLAAEPVGSLGEKFLPGPRSHPFSHRPFFNLLQIV
jgi:hypothetical protein